MAKWLGDQYDIQGMDSLSGLVSKRIYVGICNISCLSGCCNARVLYQNYLSGRSGTNP